jgi:hypothetical protein
MFASCTAMQDASREKSLSHLSVAIVAARTGVTAVGSEFRDRL